MSISSGIFEKNYEIYNIQDKPKPEVTWCPWNPTESDLIDAAYFAARGCYTKGNNLYQNLFEQEQDTEKKLKLIKHLLKKNHRSTLCHLMFSFWLEKIPQKILIQLLRQTVGTCFDAQSTRFNKFEWTKINPVDYAVIPNDSLGEEIMAAAYRTCQNAYDQLISIGWAPEQAAFVLNLGYFTSMQASYNIISLKHLYNIRVLHMTGKAQSETTEVVQAMVECFSQHNPNLAKLIFTE